MIEFIFPVLILLTLGAIAGFMAGLLGIGGGAVLVPGLYYLLKHFGYADVAMHVAVGTSLATIIFTGISSALAHNKRGAVDIPMLKNFLPGVIIGVGIGTYLADILPTEGLKIIFASSQILFGGYMLLNRNRAHLFESLPRQPFLSVFSAANAGLATMMGVGGGVQNVLFMTICNVPIHRAIATAASIGPFIATIGTAGFIFIGLQNQSLPPYSLGYFSLPAFLTIIITSITFAPLGAKAAHALPVPKLKMAFAIFMLLVSAKMIIEIMDDYWHIF